MDVHFHETLVLKWPVFLPPSSSTPSPTLLWFSTVQRDRRDQIVCVRTAGLGRRVELYADGTEALVTGTCSLVGKTLFVETSSVVATSSTPVIADPASLPPFTDYVWPGFIYSGVVSSPSLVATQPKITVVHVNAQPQDSWVNAPIEIRCYATLRAGDTSLTQLITHGEVLIYGAIVDVSFGKLVVAVRDVCSAQDAAANGHLEVGSPQPDIEQWRTPRTPRICVTLFESRSAVTVLPDVLVISQS